MRMPDSGVQSVRRPYLVCSDVRAAASLQEGSDYVQGTHEDGMPAVLQRKGGCRFVRRNAVQAVQQICIEAPWSCANAVTPHHELRTAACRLAPHDYNNAECAWSWKVMEPIKITVQQCRVT